MISNNLITAASFTPNSLQFPNAWVGHLPFAAWVIQEVCPKIFVELGTHSGNSYFSFCQSVVEGGLPTKCYAVDTWQGDEHAGQYNDEIFANVYAHNQEHYAGFSRLLRMTFDDAASYFADESIELLHIDGLHTYEAVRHDFETWLPKLAPGAVVMFHDTNVRERNFGVWKLWEELQARYPSNLEFVHSHGLGVLQLDNGSAEKKLPWLATGAVERQSLIKYFASLGARQIERYELFDLRKAVAERDGQIATLNQTVAECDGQIATLNQTVAECDGQIATLNQTVAECDGQIATLNQTVAERDGQIATLNQTVAERDGQIATLNQVIVERDQQIRHISQLLSLAEFNLNRIIESKSWKVTMIFRFLARIVRGERVAVDNGIKSHLRNIGKNIYWKIPSKYRNRLLYFCYQKFSFLFRGTPHYENWIQNLTQSNHFSGIRNHLESNFDILFDIDQQPLSEISGSVAIHLHMFYYDLADEFVAYLKNMPIYYDLYISVENQNGYDACQHSFSGLKFCQKLEVKLVPNRGRDVAPFFCTFGKVLAKYDYIAHLHSKKSLYNKGATEGWRQYLASNLLGSKDRINKILGMMQGENARGIVYPQNYILVPYAANSWLANRAMGEKLCYRLGFTEVPQGYFHFPAGSMFWAKGSALQPLFNAGITIYDFDEEVGQTDGTFAHALERLWVLSSINQGYRPCIIKDKKNPSWSAWRFDQYTSRSLESISHQLRSSGAKVIAFDIFDTLVCRPLINPESVKIIVSECLDESGPREEYLKFRTVAEGQVRQIKGADVSLDEIYDHLSIISSLSQSHIEKLKFTERQAEKNSLKIRPESLKLFQQALATGKRVVLITDMFLPRYDIEEILLTHGIVGWNHLFLSNEIGLRKDTGKLYSYVFTHFGITPSELIMIGDNERSDLQIPADMGVKSIHLIRPVEFARGHPRFSELVYHHENNRDINSELTLGLVVRNNFSAISYPSFDSNSLIENSPYNVGYSIVGPLLAGFANWLMNVARQDNIEKLYFLARDGKLIKQVYDCWVDGSPDTACTEYLVISRRAASVATISCLDDILKIASVTYFSNTISNFLFVRFGLSLSRKQWDDLTAAYHWRPDMKIEVSDSKIDHLIQLLTALEFHIIEQATKENIALQKYLSSIRIDDKQKHAVVDVGYGGTIQSYLNKILVKNPIHGYYMLTDERSKIVNQCSNAFARGCYYENIKYAAGGPLMYQHNFLLEKYLSADDAQVNHYILDTASDNVNPIYRELSAEEINCQNYRNLLQKGIMDYIKEARTVRETLFPKFQPSCSTAIKIFDVFVTHPSIKESNSYSEITLDDFYAGRGLVS